MSGSDTLNARRTLKVGKKSYAYYSLSAVAEAGFGDIKHVPLMGPTSLVVATRPR